MTSCYRQNCLWPGLILLHFFPLSSFSSFFQLLCNNTKILNNTLKKNSHIFIFFVFYQGNDLSSDVFALTIGQSLHGVFPNNKKSSIGEFLFSFLFLWLPTPFIASGMHVVPSAVCP